MVFCMIAAACTGPLIWLQNNINVTVYRDTEESGST